MAHQGWEEAAALFGRSGRPLTKAPDLRVGDVTKGQVCSFLAHAGLIKLVPRRARCALKLALQK